MRRSKRLAKQTTNNTLFTQLRRLIVPFAIIVILIDATLVFAFKTGLVSAQSAPDDTVQTVTADPVAPTISADGTITPQTQVTLHFQTGGKLIALPFKEGDRIATGQTVAQLDTYVLERQLQLAANTYETTKNTTDQTLENNQAGVLEGQQRTSLDTTNKNSYSSITEATVVYDAVKRMVDNSLLAQNSAQLNVDLANYALQLATLTAPFDGVVTHEDVTSAGQNVTPVTGFTIVDPTSLVFRANVPENEVDYVSVGNRATIHLDGQQAAMQGTVTKVYPDKTTLPDGATVYQVDIQSNQITPKSKLDLSGTAIIQSNTLANVLLVPAWTVLGGKYVWVKENTMPVLKTVSVGKTHGNEIEVTGVLSAGDKVITDPQFLSRQKYSLF